MLRARSIYLCGLALLAAVMSPAQPVMAQTNSANSLWNSPWALWNLGRRAPASESDATSSTANGRLASTLPPRAPDNPLPTPQYESTPAFQAAVPPFVNMPSAPFVPADAPTTPSQVFDLAETVARIGDQHIFRGDLIGDANVVLAPHIEKIPAEERAKSSDAIDVEREKLVKQMLREAVQRKLMYAMFLRSIPPEKLAEAKANIKERVGEQFATALEEMLEKVRVAQPSEYKDLTRQSSQLFRLAYLMKELNITTNRELDLALRRYGSSLEKQQQAYAEDQLGRQEMFKEARSVAEVTYDDMVTYYQEHLDDFRVPTRARWEQITVKFDRFPSRFAAGEEIARIGNELFYGAPFKTVAKRSSQGEKASEGGFHDWTEWGDFKISREINEAVFSLTPSELSYIIEDPEGLHIIRVLEREETHIIPFTDAQLTIRERIQGDRRTEAINKYLEQLQKQIPVWNIYDDPAAETAQR